MNSEERDWHGDTSHLVVEGNFASGGGLSTALTLLCRDRNSDGSLQPWRELRTVNAPGVYVIHVPPCRYKFSACGPEGIAWDVRARLEVPAKAPKTPTTEQRLASAEQQLRDLTRLDRAKHSAKH